MEASGNASLLQTNVYTYLPTGQALLDTGMFSKPRLDDLFFKLCSLESTRGYREAQGGGGFVPIHSNYFNQNSSAFVYLYIGILHTFSLE